MSGRTVALRPDERVMGGILRYVDRECSRCGVTFRVLATRKRTECYTCKPAKGRRG